MLTVGYWGAIVVEISSSDGYIYRLDAIYVLCSAPVWHILSDVSAGLMLVLFWLQNWFAGMVFSIVFYNHVKVYQSGATAIKSIQVTICPGILRFLTSKGKHSVVPRGYEKNKRHHRMQPFSVQYSSPNSILIFHSRVLPKR